MKINQPLQLNNDSVIGQAYPVMSEKCFKMCVSVCSHSFPFINYML